MNPRSAAERALARLDHQVRSAISASRERRFDRRHGVRTAGLQELSRGAAGLASFRHACSYQAVPETRFLALMQALAPAPQGITFIDLGCGKGKALVLAALHGFGRVIGVELDPVLASEATANAQAFGAAHPTRTRIEVATADATSFALPPGPLLVFMYNPFDAAVMVAVREQLDRSLRADPRPVTVVYLNPVQEKALTSSTTLVAADLDRSLTEPERVRPLRGWRGHEHGGDLRAVVLVSQPAAQG